MPFWLLPLAIVGGGLAAFTPNPGLTIAAILSLAALFALLWRPGQPAVLLFICGMQWLQGSLKVFHADLLGVELWTLSRSRSIEAATYLTLAWVVLMAAGARIALRRAQERDPIAPSFELAEGDSRALFLLYGAWTIASIGLQYLVFGGLRQFAGAVSHLRWAVVFAIFVSVIKSKRGRLAGWLVLLFEVANGFLSYFSSFKMPLFVLALATLGAGHKFSLRQVAGLVVVGAATLYLGVVWSAIKMDYRERLNAGTGDQVVAIDAGAQVRELVQVLGAVDTEVLGYGYDQLIERIAYVDYFGHAIDYVPALRPHEGGALWAEAFRHVLMPRLLFPDKAPLRSDTEVTELYTGFTLQSSQQQTSITLGLPAVTYVDFGPVWMFVVPVLLGLMYGAAVRYFWAKDPGHPLAAGFATAVVLQQSSVGSSPEKVLGGQITTFVIAAVLWHLTPRLLEWIRRTDDALGRAVRRG